MRRNCQDVTRPPSLEPQQWEDEYYNHMAVVLDSDEHILSWYSLSVYQRESQEAFGSDKRGYWEHYGPILQEVLTYQTNKLLRRVCNYAYYH